MERHERENNMTVQEFIGKYFRAVECKYCGQSMVFIPDKFKKDGKPKTVNLDGSPHWSTCTSDSSKAFRAKLAAEGGAKRPAQTDNSDY